MSQDTIESLRARVAELEVELENEQARGIHSCHPGCLRDGCVNRRLRDQLAAQALTIKTMREALNIWINIAANCSIESGCCCCGESMKNHSHPMSCGHSPVDMADSIAYEAIAETDKALALPDNSTEILQEWLDKQLGEPVVEAIQEPGSAVRWWWSDEGLALPKGTFLYRKPEIK